MGLKTSIEQEKIVFAYMLKHPQYLLHVENDFFNNEDIQYIANCAKLFFKEYKDSPSCEQMKAILKDDKKNIDNETVESIYNVDIITMDDEWLKDTTESWLKWRAFNTNFIKAATVAKTTEVTLDNVKSVVDKCVGLLSDTTLMNFDRDLGFDFLMLKITNQSKKKRYHTLGIILTEVLSVVWIQKHSHAILVELMWVKVVCYVTMLQSL